MGRLLAHPSGHADIGPGRPLIAGELDGVVQGVVRRLEHPETLGDGLKPLLDGVVELSNNGEVHVSTVPDAETNRQEALTAVSGKGASE